MPEFMITCPNCEKKFPLSKAMTSGIENSLRKNMEQQFELERESIEKKHDKHLSEVREKIEKDVKRKAQKEAQAELNDLKKELKDTTDKLDEARKKELALNKRERELVDKEKGIGLELEKRLEEESKKIWAKATEAAKAEQRKQEEVKDAQITRLAKQVEETGRANAEKLSSLENELEEKNKQIDEARKKEIEFRKRERELADKEKGIGLELEKRLEEKSKEIWAKATEAAKAEQRKQEEVKDAQITRLAKQVEEAGRASAEKLSSMEKELEAKEKQLDEARERETEIRKRERELVDKEKGIGLELEKRLEEESKKIWAKATEAAKAEQRKEDEAKDTQISDLKKRVKEATQLHIDSVASLENELEEKNKQIDEARKKEIEFRKRERELADREKGIGIELEKRLEEESKEIWAKATEAAKAEQRKQELTKDTEINSLKKQLEEIEKFKTTEIEKVKEDLEKSKRQLVEAQDKERQILQKEKELFDKEKTLDIKVAEELQKERQSVWDKAIETANQQHYLKDTEKDKQISDLKVKIEELSLRAQQSSQQLQGESLELDIEQTLRISFPKDDIEPVAKGVRGGDVIQTIYVASSQARVLWEIKNTKNWSDAWIEKLKDDKRDARADAAIIVTRALPKGITRFGERDGIWICDLQTVLGLAGALRAQLIEIAQIRLANTGKDHKMSLLYDYLTGEEFKQRIQAIVETYRALQIDLNKERAAVQRMWNKREKQIQRATFGAAGMYGDLQGIIGASLPELKILELPEGNTIEDIDDSE